MFFLLVSYITVRNGTVFERYEIFKRINSELDKSKTKKSGIYLHEDTIELIRYKPNAFPCGLS